jgi:ATP-dependent RNA helicase DeaD
MKFEELNLGSELLNSIDRLGITTPTEIQEKSIPHILLGKDTIGESATGSGKTLAFGCGILEQVTPNKGLQALVLVPTRELAEQVKEALNKFSIKKTIKVTAVYGGVAINPQMTALKVSEVVVATPGRLFDHMNQRTIDLRKVKLLVLDEADRMLDMGFIKDVEKIIRKCPTNRQTLFFSATISTEIKNLANKYMKDPLTVSAVNQVDPSKLKQVYYNASGGLKLPLLVNLLKNEKQGLVMVFCNMRSSVDFVVKNLKKNKVDAMAIHGGLTQNKRTKMMDMFNGGKFGVLVCTDVAARGLHIDNVSHVYNYEIPRDAKDYVHRIGRTARAGEEGMVVNILAESDHENFSKVLREYNNFQIDKIDTPQLERVTIVKRDNFRPKGRFGNKGKFSNNGNGFRKNNGNSFRGGNRSRW